MNLSQNLISNFKNLKNWKESQIYSHLKVIMRWSLDVILTFCSTHLILRNVSSR
jgi:uncharacterized membrane protein required for colicin V production